MSQPRVLVDVDGVLAAYVDPVVELVNRAKGTAHTVHDVVDWDIYTALGVGRSLGELIDMAICQPGFCARLKPYDGAAAAIAALREFAEVYAVTAPFNSDHWMREREKWLAEHMGFYRKKVNFVHDKHVVVGDVLIDDKVSTLVKWREHHPAGTAVLFAQPWNRTAEWDGVRTNDWTAIIEMVKNLCA